MKNRFRCISKIRALEYHLTKVGLIINACCVLHNICTRGRLPDPEELDAADDGGVGEPLEDEEEGDGVGNNRNRRRNPLLIEGERVRHQYLIRPINLLGEGEE